MLATALSQAENFLLEKSVKACSKRYNAGASFDGGDFKVIIRLNCLISAVELSIIHGICLQVAAEYLESKR